MPAAWFATLIESSIFLTVLGLGLTATTGEALSVLRSPRTMLRSLAPTMVVAPLLAVLLVRVLPLQPPVAIALGALAVSPVPPLWPRKTLKAGGERRYTIGLLVALSAISIVLVPTLLVFLAPLLAVKVHAPVSTIVRIMFISVLLPIAAGLTIRRVSPRAAD